MNKEETFIEAIGKTDSLQVVLGKFIEFINKKADIPDLFYWSGYGFINIGHNRWGCWSINELGVAERSQLLRKMLEIESQPPQYSVSTITLSQAEAFITAKQKLSITESDALKHDQEIPDPLAKYDYTINENIKGDRKVTIIVAETDANLPIEDIIDTIHGDYNKKPTGSEEEKVEGDLDIAINHQGLESPINRPCEPMKSDLSSTLPNNVFW